MQIACERCGTTYVLDERLLPAAGAPVQCTKCTHVFTAKPPAAPGAPPPVVRAATNLMGVVQPGPRVTPIGTPLESAAPPNRSSTQMFGAAQVAAMRAEPVPAAPARSSTQMFGAADVAALRAKDNVAPVQAPVSNPAQAPAAPARSSTQMFGAAEVAALRANENAAPAQSPPSSNSPGPAAPPRSSTQMFGGPLESAAPPRNATQMFAGVNEPAAPQRSATQMFGGVTEAAAPQRSATQMFGGVTEAAAPQRSSTQMFGAQGGTDNLEASLPMEEDGAAGGAPSNVFSGASSSPEDSAQPAGSSTRIFGNPFAAAAAEEAAAPKADRTMRFALSDIDPNAAPPPQAPIALQRRPSRPALDAQPSPDGPSLSIEISPDLMAEANQPEARSSVDLPPEQPNALSFPIRPDVSAPTDKELADLALPRRSFAWLGWILVLGLLGGGAYAGFQWYEKQKTRVPPELQSMVLAAQSLVRADDSVSLKRSLDQLTSAQATMPTWVEPKAWRVISLVLQLADSRTEHARLLEEARKLKEQIEELQTAKSSPDWENRANALGEQLAKVRQETDAATQARDDAEKASSVAYEALPVLVTELSAADELALTRAELVYQGVRGGSLTDLIARFKTQGGTDGWDVVARAESALNSQSDTEKKEASLKEVQALRQTDPSFLRAHLLAAKLAAALGQTETAVTALEAAVTFNPNHTLAHAMLRRFRAEQ